MLLKAQNDSAGDRDLRSRAFTLERPSRTRGSVLIVALLVSALIAVVLGSYLNLNLSSSRLARRTFNGYAALNLAEAGIEEAVWSFNRTTAGDASAWADWTQTSGSGKRKFGPFALSQNSAGWTRVYVDNVNPSAFARPKIVSQSTVGAEGETPVTKMLEVTLRRRSYFAGGLVAKERVVFSGANISVDSWNSDPDQSAATAPVPFSAAVRTDHGTVASAAFVNSSVLLNNATIWGNVATGGEQPQVGANGSIRGANTPANIAVDSRRVTTDFSANFDVVGGAHRRNSPLGARPDHWRRRDRYKVAHLGYNTGGLRYAYRLRRCNPHSHGWIRDHGH